MYFNMITLTYLILSLHHWLNICIYGAKRFGDSGPFNIKPKAQAEEGKTSEDE